MEGQVAAAWPSGLRWKVELGHSGRTRSAQLSVADFGFTLTGGFGVERSWLRRCACGGWHQPPADHCQFAEGWGALGGYGYFFDGRPRGRSVGCADGHFAERDQCAGVAGVTCPD